MKNFLVRYCLMAVSLSSLMTSCIKDDLVPLTDQGTTSVRFYEGSENKIYFSPFTTVRKVDLFNIRKDANSNASLQQPTAVKLTASRAMLDAYNKSHNETFEWLPESLYTLASTEGIQKNSDGYTFNFASGDFAKDLSINLDGSKWDLSRKYAVAYAISDAGGATIKPSNDSIIVFVSIKNQYDGTYRSTGYFTHPTASSSRAIDKDKTLTTVNLTTVVTEFADLGSSGWLMWLTVNADNTVTITPKGSTASGVIQEGVNKYDPSTKTFTLNYKYSGSGGFRVVTETIKLK